MIQPFRDRIFVKLDEPESKTSGGLIIPDTFKVKPRTGIVTATGGEVEADVAADMHVVLGPYSGMMYRYHDEDILIIGRDDIVALVTEFPNEEVA